MIEKSNNIPKSKFFKFKQKCKKLEGINENNVSSFLNFLRIIITIDIASLAGNIFLDISQDLTTFVCLSTVISIIATMVLYLQLTHYQGSNEYPKFTTITFSLALAPAIFVLETFFIVRLYSAANTCNVIITILISFFIAYLIYKKMYKNKEQ